MSETIRALVVDDEPLARRLLRRLLEDEPGIEVVGEAGSAAAALRAIEEHHPDLVFLDVQMPGEDGFAVVRALGDDAPAVIFVTAFEQYAVRAFEVHALDYLLKPFDEVRLHEALARARRKAGGGLDAELRRRILALAREMGARPATSPTRLAVREGERLVLLRADAIDRIEAEGKHMRIHAGGRTYTLRETMARLEEILDRATFVRVSRSTIVNMERVREIRPWFAGGMLLLLEGGAKVTATRGYRGRLEAVLGS